MKLQFKYKNNFEVYNVDEGSTLTENYNETLDSATIRISHLKDKIDIEPFDEVMLFDEYGRFDKKWMCIDTYLCTEEGLDEPTYSYEITLFSQTKLLEGVILPNLSITNATEGVYAYLERYLNLYSLKIRLQDNTFVNKWYLDIDDEHTAKLKNTKCPEFQWNTPTLREVLNDLCMVIDCIPVLSNNAISLIDLTIKKNKVTGYNYITESQSSADYVSEIQMNMQNVMQTQVDGVDNTVTTSEYLTLTCDDYVITTENILLKTQFPILRLKHLWMIMYINTNTEEGNSSLYKKVKIDICNLQLSGTDVDSLVKEYKEFQTLPVLYRTIATYASAQDYYDKGIKYFSGYQNYCLYYNRGSNTIEGFANVNKGRFRDNKTTYEWIRDLAESKWLVDNNLGNYAPEVNTFASSSTSTYFNTYFQIEYETMSSQVFRASKQNYPTNNRVVIDNQTNSWVDAFNQGSLEYQKVNRLGNKSIMINARNSLIKIGDYKDDNIVYKCEYQIYANHFEVNATATKDYILKNYFTGVKSKIRTWVNAKDEAFERHDLIKNYCILSYKKYQEYVDTDTDLASYLCTPFTSTTIKPIEYVLTRTNEMVDNQYYLLNCLSRVVGNSLVFTVGFEDNGYVGKHPVELEESNIIDNTDNVYSTFYLKENGTIKENGGIPLGFYKYVDDNLSFKDIEFNFLNDIQIFNESIALRLPWINQVLRERIYLLPLVTYIYNKEVKYRNSITAYYKDNREIPIISTQLEIVSDNINKIEVGKYFIQYQEAVRNIAMPTLKILINDTEIAYSSIVVNNITNLCSEIVITLNSERQFRTTEVIKICDNSNNVLLTLKEYSSVITNEIKFYMNVLKSRNLNVYDSQKLQKIVGSILQQ